jgi:hypothetical protein
VLQSLGQHLRQQQQQQGQQQQQQPVLLVVSLGLRAREATQAWSYGLYCLRAGVEAMDVGGGDGCVGVYVVCVCVCVCVCV